jgi:hypothetical protein
VTVDGRPADAAWEAFLDRLVDYLDRDGDGVPSAAEAGRLFLLPLPVGRAAAMDFARHDSDHDGKGNRAEFKTFYRTAGFGPIIVETPPAPAERLRLPTLGRTGN